MFATTSPLQQMTTAEIQWRMAQLKHNRQVAQNTAVLCFDSPCSVLVAERQIQAMENTMQRYATEIDRRQAELLTA